MKRVQCFQCRKELSFADRVGLREECPHCRSDVHVCKNCEFFDAKAYNECRENQAERVMEKDRANRCEYFSVRTQSLDGISKADQLREAAEALFKKK